MQSHPAICTEHIKHAWVHRPHRGGEFQVIQECSRYPVHSIHFCNWSQWLWYDNHSRHHYPSVFISAHLFNPHYSTPDIYTGKSNLMDAISFVLGMKTQRLRSSNLRELVYKGPSETKPAAGIPYVPYLSKYSFYSSLLLNYIHSALSFSRRFL